MNMANYKKLLGGVGLVVALTASSVVPALAAEGDTDTSDVSAAVAQGPRTVTVGDVAFGTTAYSFESHGLEATGVAMEVVDESGTDGGWQVTMSATDLVADGSADAIPASGFTVAAVTNITAAGNGADELAAPAAGSLAGDLSGDGIVVLAAANGTGAGSWTATVDFGLTIPAGQDIDSYSTTLTTTIVVAPID